MPGSSTWPTTLDIFHDPSAGTLTNDPVYDHAVEHTLLNDGAQGMQANLQHAGLWAQTAGAGQAVAAVTPNVASLSGVPASTVTDGVTVTAGQVVLLTGQTTGTQNGPWTVNSGAWTRPTWWPTGMKVIAPSPVYVTGGQANGPGIWVLSSAGPVTVDTTATTWSKTLDARVITTISTLRTAAFTATAGQAALCDVSSGGFTVTLPSAPADQSLAEVILVNVTNAAGNLLTIAAGSGDAIIATGATLVLGQGRQTAALLQYRSTGRTWQVVTTARRVGNSWVDVTDPQWGGADVNGDWTTAAKNVSAFLAVIPGVFYFPGSATAYKFGITSPSTPGVVIPSNCCLLGDGIGASILQAATGMTANLVQDAAYGNTNAASVFPRIDQITLQGANNPASNAFQYATVVTSFSSGTLVVDQIPAAFKHIPVSGSTAWDSSAAPSVGSPGLVWVADQQVQYTGTTVLDGTTAASLGTAIPAGTYTNGSTYNFTVATGLGLPASGNLVVKLASAFPQPSGAPGYFANGVLGGGGFIQAFTYNSGTGVISFASWAGPTITTAGTTGVGYYALTGCTLYGGGSLAVAQTGIAEVRASNSQGHCCAFQAAYVHIGRSTYIQQAVGSNIYLQTSPSGQSTFAHDIWPSRMSGPGRFQVEVGPSVTDGRLGGFSCLTGDQTFGGVLIGGGDWNVFDIHHVANLSYDCPPVIVVGGTGAVVIRDVVDDTSLSSQMMVDNSGRWATPGAAKDIRYMGGASWVDNGPLAPGVGTVPFFLYRSATGAQLLRGGFGPGISTPNSYTYGIQNGATGRAAGLRDNGSANVAVALPQTTIYTDNASGFNPFGGSITVPGSGGAQTVGYTQIAISVGVVNGTQSVTPGAAGTLAVSADTNKVIAFDSAGVLFIQTGGNTVLEQPYASVSTSISGSNTIYTFTFSSWNGTGTSVGNNSLVIQHRFTGCSAGSGNITDLGTITQPALAAGAISGFDVSPILNIPKLVSPANLLTGDTVSSGNPVVANRSGNITPALGEYSVGAPSANPSTYTLPAKPYGGANPVYLDLSTIAAGKSYLIKTSDGSTITPSWTGVAVAGSTGLTVQTAGTAYWMFWDNINSTWRVIQIAIGATLTGSPAAGSNASGVYTGASDLIPTSATAATWGTRSSLFNSSGTFTIPAGATLLRLTAVGGGGQGGGAGSATGSTLQTGGSGGGAGAAVEQVVPVGSATTLTVTVGAGGSAAGGGGAANGNAGTAGSNGANTTVTGTGISVTANGGSGGNASAGNSTTTVTGGPYGQDGALPSVAAGGPGAGGGSGKRGGDPFADTGGGGGGGVAATATNGGNGGGAGGLVNGGGSTGTQGGAAGGNGTNAAANTGAGGGGGGGGAAGTGAGGNGGNGGSGWALVEIIG